MSERAFLGISHTPLLGLNQPSVDIEKALRETLDAASRLVKEFDPELIVLVAPDHYNGFFNELMPPFCIGTEAQALGDFLTPAGALNVDADFAVTLASHLMDDNFDVAVSRRMRVDHGFAQPLQLMFGGLNTPPVVPIFLNAVATPSIPRMRRCRAFGKSVGRLLDGQSRRTLVVGSGGLSHEPPVPTLAHPDPAVRERITVRWQPTAADREARMQRVMEAGRALAAGGSSIKPLNPVWDQKWMDALAGNESDVESLCAMDEDSIARDAGLSAHESKNWLVARSAMPYGTELVCKLRYYQSIPEFIAGFGVMFLTQTH